MQNIISIGGIGGSGTRVVAKIVQELGYFIGDDLNKPLDNLLFTFLFKRQNILTLSLDEFDLLWNLFKKLMYAKTLELTAKENKLLDSLCESDRTLHTLTWLKERREKIELLNSNKLHRKWAWKEPNTHVIIDKLLEKEKNLKFIYLYRNGLDMAHSSNQNQLKLWGSIFFNDYNIQISPRNSLKYWVTIHKRMSALKQKYPNRLLLLEFESLCYESDKKIEEISLFCGESVSSETVTYIKSFIKLPISVGRHKNFSFDEYNIEDVNYAREISLANKYNR